MFGLPGSRAASSATLVARNAATFWTYFSRRGSICSKTSKLSGFRSRKLLPLPSLATTSIVTMRVAVLKVVIGSLSWLGEAEAAGACWPLAQPPTPKAMQTAAVNGRARLRRRKKPPNAKGRMHCALVLRQAQGDSLLQVLANSLHCYYDLRVIE